VHFPRHFRPFCLSHSLYPSLIALILVLRLPRFWSLDDLSLDIMGSPAPPATSTTSGLPKIPTDLLLVIREHLVLNHQIGTAAKLMTCSKAFFELFEPVVDYTSLTVSSRNKDKLFWGLTGRKCSALPPVNAEYQHKCQASLKARQVETSGRRCQRRPPHSSSPQDRLNSTFTADQTPVPAGTGLVSYEDCESISRPSGKADLDGSPTQRRLAPQVQDTNSRRSRRC